VTRWWISWWTDDEATPVTAWTWWVSGWRDEHRASICAVIDAEDEDHAWAVVGAAFEDYDERFIEARPDGWEPGEDRFTPRSGPKECWHDHTACEHDCWIVCWKTV
jgi:hypothetical protein